MTIGKPRVTTFDRKLEEERAYWLERLSGELEEANLRLDYERPTSYSAEKDVVRVALSEELTSGLTRLVGDSPFLLYTTLMAALKVCLQRYTGNRTIIVGSPRRRRDDEPNRKANAVVILDEIEGQVSFRQLLLSVRETLVQAYARQSYQYDRLVKALKIEKAENKCPLFAIALALEEIHEEMPEVKNDITITFLQSAGQLNGEFKYNARLFRRESIERFASHFINVLAAALKDINTPVSKLDILSAAERHRILEEWNETTTDYPQDRCIHELFEEQVERTPDALAVVFEEQQLNYRELNQRANQLAHYLRELGVGPEDKVGIMMNRSLEMVISVLGVLKAGAAYLPLDPEYPQERLSFMLKDAAAKVLLTKQELSEQLPSIQVRVVVVDAAEEEATLLLHSGDNVERHAGAQNLAYVIYTSGSTGTPKGVMIEHQSLVNLVLAQRHAFRVTSHSRLLQFASPSFDASVSELFVSLCAGATLSVWQPTGGLFSTTELMAELSARRVTVVTLPPSVLVAANPGSLSELETVVAAGEKCPAEAVERWGVGRRMLNAYGPTEVTVCATAGECEVGEDSAAVASPSIGRAIANVEVYILDARMEPVAIGVRGELYIGGRGVGRGYLNRPELTAEKFVPHPFSTKSGERLYRTGDIARYLEDGQVEYLGRVDEQVKVRGYRIELGEIEATLSQHSVVREAVVIVREDVPGEKRLVAYVVSKEAETEGLNAQLRSFVQERLPAYMIPSAFVQLAALPLTPNGKVDRKALPAPEHGGAEGSYVAPHTPTEELLAAIWGALLKVERIGIYDNFFELGGHSLLATQLVSRIREAFNVELPLAQLFETPTVADISGVIEAERRKGKKFQAPPIKPVSREVALPLSFAQQRLWFLDQLEPGSSLYNILTAVRLNGQLNVAALERTLNEIIRRHEVLRTSFPVIDGNPAQLIAPAQPIHLSVIDLSRLAEADSEAEVRRVAAEEAERPFDLAQGPLLRVCLLRLSGEEHALIFTMHHIISDGWSMSVLIREVATLYEAYCEGRPSPLPELIVQYADFAHWQRQWLQGEVLEAQLAYWEQQLGGTLPVLELPTDRTRPAVQSYHGATQSFMLDKSLSEALRDLSRQEGVTLFMTLLAAFQTLLARYSGQEEIIVGTDIANRNRGETEALIGFFVNQLVMRTDLSDDPTFSELLRRVREATLSAYAHQDLPFELLVQRLHPERDLSRAPIFQTKLVLQNVPQEELKLPGLTLSSVDVENAAARFDLTLVMIDLPDGLSGFIEYNTDLFDDSRMTRLLGHFNRLLKEIVDGHERRISELPLLSDAERQQALIEWNQTEIERPHNASIQQFFEAQAAQTPEAIAVTFQDQELPYDELNRRANQLAHYLRRIGIGPEVRVGICMERSVEMLIGVLGILKAGGAFVPLDPEYSIERLSFMLEDAQVPVLLTQERLEDELPTFWGQVICLDSEWEILAEESDHNPTNITEAVNLAYVIYTSGSTGRPKGVLLQHGGLCNLALEQIRAFKVQPGSRVLQFASLSFDASVWEIFMALTSGATLCLEEREKLSSGTELVQVLSERGITVATLPPAILSVMPAPELPALQTLITAGEKCSREILEKWSAGRRFFNAYGPTESTVCATMTAWTSDSSQEPPIGRPIANTQVYLLDAKSQPVPVGVTGELHIGGAGLARGYLNQPALTAEKFIPDPFSAKAGARLYRTGDLARYLVDGNIEFIGRVDQQVKLRGHRIELGEIEVTLSQHAAVREAVVTLREDEPGEKRLVAYLVLEGETPPSTSDIRSYLQEQLPSYMVPAAFVWLEELPLTRNGKVDRRALPSPELAGGGSEDKYIAPRTATEELIASLWSEVLKVERVGACDNFFELGGHSLLATQLISRIREAFNIELLLVTLFEKPTVEQLAQTIEQRRTEQETPAVNRITRRSSDQASLELDGLSDEEVNSLLNEMMAEEQVNP